ncbi:MAG: hypothetical protein ABI882_16385 [Acidobacteriota bacterium]
MKFVSSPRLMLLSQLCLLALCTQIVRADDALNNWQAVQNLKPGTKLEVKPKTGRKVQGKVISVTADSVTITGSKNTGQDIEFKRDEIAQIRRKSTGETLAATAIGSGLGLGAGYGIGYGIGEAAKARYPTEYGGAILGAAAGAVTGGFLASRGRVIYKAP